MSEKVKKRGKDTYWFRICIGRDPETGKRKWLTQTVRCTKKAAQQIRDQRLAELAQGRLVLDRDTTLNQYLDWWLTTVVIPAHPDSETAGEYADHMRRYVRDKLGDTKLVEIKAPMLQEMYADLLVKGLIPTTVRKVHRVLSSAFKYAVGIDAIYRNPAQAVRPPKLVQREMQVLSAAQTRRMLAACEDNPRGLCSTWQSRPACAPRSIWP